MNQLDVLVLSSISEGQPLVLLEGMVCGIPFVTTDVGNCEGLILGEQDDLGKAGIVVPVMNYVEMSKAIIYLSQDEKMRQRMGNIGCERAKRFYTKKRFIEKYQQLYEDMVKS